MRRWLLVVAFAAASCGTDDERVAPDAVATTVAESPSSTSAPPRSSPASTVGGAVVPVGFERVAVTVTNADGSVCELCLWRAQTAAERARGLMGVTDLGAADGMAFVYDTPSRNRFWMGGTPMALDIAWFDATGSFVSSAPMTPCLTGREADCPRYAAAGPYSLAIELPLGALASLGIGPGSVAALGAGTGCAPG